MQCPPPHGLPPAQGLYDPAFEHDACGMGFVASIREIVNQKDAFTRMDQAREQERQARLAAVEQEKRKKQERERRIDAAKQELCGLFGTSLTPQQRGKKLETAAEQSVRRLR